MEQSSCQKRALELKIELSPRTLKLATLIELQKNSIWNTNPCSLIRSTTTLNGSGYCKIIGIWYESKTKINYFYIRIYILDERRNPCLIDSTDGEHEELKDNMEKLLFSKKKGIT